MFNQKNTTEDDKPEVKEFVEVEHKRAHNFFFLSKVVSFQFQIQHKRWGVNTPNKTGKYITKQSD
jgi:hypothetical protein